MKFKLSFGLKFEEIYTNDGLKKIDNYFLEYLSNLDEGIYENFLENRKKIYLEDKEYSAFIIKYGIYLEGFLVDLFNIELFFEKFKSDILKLDPIFLCRKFFVQKFASRKYSLEEVKNFDLVKLKKDLTDILEETEFSEINFARKTLEWLKNNEYEKLEIASKYSCFALLSEEGKKIHKNDVIFDLPNKLDYNQLIDWQITRKNDLELINIENSICRTNFSLIDKGKSQNFVMGEVNYCIYCHNQKKDSCSKGLKSVDLNNIISPLGVELKGCPLGQKISEMNYLKSKSHSLAALAVAIIDNPMIAATGHRICNDCMKSCIYQKQRPVNIPEIETRILKDILNLPYGFEIYSLLTRWNPLKLDDYLPKDFNNYKILVVGLGPAGFSLAHYLLNQGHIIVGIDGLKIEKINPIISGIDIDGNRTKFEPILDIENIFEDLNERIPQGFGGVEEYGITSRWNKNYLKIIRILLERRENFLMFGGIRFGSNISYDKSWSLGFHHISLAIGAGKPNILNVKNSLIKGIRHSSDFLMNLQSTSVNRKKSLANLQIRMPILVVGGGLTAIDSATEALTYYLIQIEKFYENYHLIDTEDFHATLNEEEKEICLEYLSHAEELIYEKEMAKSEKREVNLVKLVKKWGGVRVIYRNNLRNSPAYRLNHEEIKEALNQSIEFIENAEIIEVKKDKFNHFSGIKIVQYGKNHDLEARSMILALGVNRNNILSEEYPEIFSVKNGYLTCNKNLEIKSDFSDKEKENAISFFGDANPLYSGSVVKAMASAKDNYKKISQAVTKYEKSNINKEDFFKTLNHLLISEIKQVNRLTDDIIELIIKSPLAAEEFFPGQFYKLQNYEFYNKMINNFNLATESIALTGISADKIQGTISLIISEKGGSSSLCKFLMVGEKVSLMGPTGQKTQISPKEKLILIGVGGISNLLLYSISNFAKEKQCEIIYFAAYEKEKDRCKINDIEKSVDQVIWICEEKILEKNRINDLTFHGNIIDALKFYCQNDISKNLKIKLSDVDNIFIMGPTKITGKLTELFQHELKYKMKENCKIIASINSSMQCMMKGICAQCLQEYYDKNTDTSYYIYNCVNQERVINQIDFERSNLRLKQNSLQEKLTKELLKKFVNNKI